MIKADDTCCSQYIRDAEETHLDWGPRSASTPRPGTSASTLWTPSTSRVRGGREGVDRARGPIGGRWYIPPSGTTYCALVS